MRAALMVHYLERISDHGVDIGGSTVFLVTGERIEDAMRQYLDRENSSSALQHFSKGVEAATNARIT
jgi:phosphate uptake regulator